MRRECQGVLVFVPDQRRQLYNGVLVIITAVILRVKGTRSSCTRLLSHQEQQLLETRKQLQ